MKKNILLSLLILFSIQLLAQEKGAYISLWSGVGPSGFRYEMKNINFASPKRNILIGGQAGVGFSYYFTKHIGVSVGLDFSHYRSKATLNGTFLNDRFFELNTEENPYKDNDPVPGHTTNYILRVRTQNWTEFQSGKFIEIPILFNLQKKFGDKEYFGIYMAAGLKVQIPFGGRYAIVDGANNDDKLMVSGYYFEENLELGGINENGTLKEQLPWHGYDKIANPSQVLTNAKGKLSMGLNFSAVAEAGILISLSHRVDIALGAFIDGGLSDINKKGGLKALFSGPQSDYVSGAENNVGNGILYNPLWKSQNSDELRYVNKVKTISYGGKFSIRVKLGKLSQREEPQSISQAPCEKDTVFIYKFEPQPIDSLLDEIMRALKQVQQTEPTPAPIMPAPAVVYEGMEVYNPDNIPKDDISFLFTPIYFDLDKFTLRPESILNLDVKVAILNRHPEIKLVILGNTCDLGDDPHNFKLGQNRAEAARNYLISKGIAPDRLNPNTLSRFQPERPNTNEPNRTHNRRADFRPVYPLK